MYCLYLDGICFDAIAPAYVPKECDLWFIEHTFLRTEEKPVLPEYLEYLLEVL
jgi:hypothetical protein